ncbi:MAG: AAA family ATPase [Burkholderiales bacterium]
MRLLSLEVANFRAFYGVQRIEFAAEDDKRVTVFHGENGAGKTNLLNAVHWCMTGQFTPRFQEQRLLINREAYRAGQRECHVELIFQDEMERGGHQYRVRRSATNEAQTGLEVYQIDRGNSRPIPNGQSLLRMLLPLGLVSWFFFDAEAIGSLELSGSPEFKRDLRKTLGFDLVDTLLQDLEAVQSKRRREVANQTNDRELTALQNEMDNIDRVLPGQQESAVALESRLKQIESSYEEVRSKLGKLPQAEPIERQRRETERKMLRLEQERKELDAKVAQLIGQAAPFLLLQPLTAALEGKLEQEEVRGKLPAPYSDQLVRDIETSEVCICGRPVLEGSAEAHKIHELLRFASTGALNQRLSEVRYLIRDIERQSAALPPEIAKTRNRIVEVDQELGRLEQECKDLTKQLNDIKGVGDEIQRLESERERLSQERRSVAMQAGAMMQQIEQNVRKHKELKVRFEATERRLVVSKKLKVELDKVTRLMDYIRRSLIEQERQALTILAFELNTVLKRYLTKHYSAKINPATYAVQLVDQEGKTVGHSTGEGQVLKFAFIATVVALAARKTQQKIQWMSEPTIAPLVLDAPFSALDPEYQGSVARNLATQTTQLVLMISSAAWGEKVEAALDPVVGKRYLIVSHESGAQGDKPIKRLRLKGADYQLNYYGAERTESTFVEVM